MVNCMLSFIGAIQVRLKKYKLTGPFMSVEIIFHKCDSFEMRASRQKTRDVIMYDCNKFCVCRLLCNFSIKCVASYVPLVTNAD